MDGGFEAEEKSARGAALALQPRVSEAELAEFGDTPEARQLARLFADQEIMLRLSVEGFDGRAWAEVATALVQYGWAVMGAWIVTGRVFVKCREKGFAGDSLTPPTTGIARSEAEELAADTVADAIVNFRDKVLRPGRWDAAKGASLSTFFIGNCLLRFVNRYRRWCAQRRYVPTNDIELDLSHDDDPEHAVIRNERIAELLAPIHDEKNREIVQLEVDGYAIDEIAELVGMTYNRSRRACTAFDKSSDGRGNSGKTARRTHRVGDRTVLARRTRCAEAAIAHVRVGEFADSSRGEGHSAGFAAAPD